MSLQNIRIVLVEPSHPGNIGGAARALKTMGLTRLVIVNPKRFPDPQAEWRAAGAQDVLANVQVFDRLAPAIEDCVWVAGTSTRQRRIPWPCADATTVAGDVLRQASLGEVAILFGRENSGLNNEELQRCHMHLQIPAFPGYPSLNLAMAVQVVCYEIYRQFEAGSVVGGQWDRPLATVGNVEAMLEHLQRLLVATDFLDPSNPRQTLPRLRRLLMRVELDATEVQMVRGILTHLQKALSSDPGE